MGGYPVAVIEERDGLFFIDDRNTATLSVDEATLRASRARVSSYRNRLVTLDAPTEITTHHLVNAIEAGLQDQIGHLESDSDSFSLPAWRKWARMVTDTKHKKGWANAFADQRGLFGVLLTVYESIDSSGFGGGSLRGLYAEFLDTAAEVTDRPALERVSALYRDLDRQWIELAERVTPRDQEPFSRARELIDSLHEQVLDGGDAERPAAEKTAKELWRLRTARDGGPLFDADTFAEFLQEMRAGIHALYEAERDSLAELAAAIKSSR
jgi:hypothetical protein